jgi:group I intron endonuclease
VPEINYPSGVYGIRNRINSKIYVGSACRSLLVRKGQHLSLLQRGCHYNRHLQRAYNKYGRSSFVFTILERCDSSKCVEREQWWIDHFQSANDQFGYNLSPTAGNTLGVIHTAQARSNMSKAHTGIPLSPTHRSSLASALQSSAVRSKISNSLKGKKHSAETKLKMSLKRRGRTLSPEHRAKIGAAHLGKKQSEETRKRISEVQQGRKASLETRIKMSAARKGRKLSEEVIEKIKKTKRERCRTPEFRRKMSKVVTQQWKKRRKSS